MFRCFCCGLFILLVCAVYTVTLQDVNDATAEGVQAGRWACPVQAPGRADEACRCTSIEGHTFNNGVESCTNVPTALAKQQQSIQHGARWTAAAWLVLRVLPHAPRAPSLTPQDPRSAADVGGVHQKAGADTAAGTGSMAGTATAHRQDAAHRLPRTALEVVLELRPVALQLGTEGRDSGGRKLGEHGRCGSISSRIGEHPPLTDGTAFLSRLQENSYALSMAPPRPARPISHFAESSPIRSAGRRQAGSAQRCVGGCATGEAAG